MRPLTPSGATPPRSPYLSARPPRNPSGLGGAFVLSSSGVVGAGAGSGDRLAVNPKTTRSASHGHGDGARPMGGLWTMPQPQDRRPARERSKTWVEADTAATAAADAMAALAAKKLEDDKGKDRGKDKDNEKDRDRDEGELAVLAATPVGLWTAKAWKSPPKRRWTVGREAWDGGSAEQ